MAESIRRRLEREEDARLHPLASRAAGATRRYPVEDRGRSIDYRTAYQRDRDRIVYSRAFRRLRQKAVAGVLPAYEDHRRNRLTHTLEVAQLARTIARALRLHEDLAEAIALGHDLGQPPFGPAGARALDDLLSGRLDGRGGFGLGDLGGFAVGWQGLRVVDRIEKRYEHPGLNLTDAVRRGILEAGGRGRIPAGEAEGLDLDAPAPLEVAVVVAADRIGSALHDLDDALQSGTTDVARVERLSAVRALQRKLGGAWRDRAGAFAKANTIHRGLTHLLVTGTILASQAALARGRAAIVLPASAHRLLEDLEAFLETRVHRGQAADRLEARGRRALLGLAAAWQADPALLDDHVLLRFREAAGVRYLRDVPRSEREAEVARAYRTDPRLARLIGDHLAAMTDAYALAEQEKLLAMGAVPIPGAEQLRREEEVRR